MKYKPVSPQLINKAVADRDESYERNRGLVATARAKSTELWNKQRAWKGEHQQAGEERTIVERHDLDLFPTPEELADRMVAIARERISKMHSKWCEPNAGTGRIVAAMTREGIIPKCYELRWACYDLLRKKGVDVTQADFLTATELFDCFVMNPPFSNHADIDHVRHAYGLLRSKGRIVAIMSESGFYNTSSKAFAWREFLLHAKHTTEQLPIDAFRASGTMVSTRLVVIDKP